MGEIPYQPWQCVAELIDNAFDDFMAETNRDPSDTPIVWVTLPKQNIAEGDEIVCVADNGRGMGKEALEQSLQAGYSSNARYGSLGLFGMGFNIATARLGTVTEVKTTREGDPDWLSPRSISDGCSGRRASSSRFAGSRRRTGRCMARK